MPAFRDILTSMITHLQDKRSKLTDFTPTSVLYQVFSAIASVIDQIYYTLQNAQKQAYISTATEAGLDAKGADLGLPRKQATAAHWHFTFTKKQASEQQIAIPKGTLITTIPQPDRPAVLFAVDASSYLPAGTLTVSVNATCLTPGTAGNIAPGTPLLIGSATPGIDGVKLVALDKGAYGSDVETDEEYRSRLLQGLSSKAQGTVAWYRQTALSVEGVQLARVVPQGRGQGTVDLYIVGAGNSVPDAALLGKVQATLDAGRLITDDAKVFPPTAVLVDLQVKIQVADGYDRLLTAEQVKHAITQHVNSLGIGGGTNGTLFMAQVHAVALAVPGVINILPTGSEQLDIKFMPNQLPQAHTLVVTAE